MNFRRDDSKAVAAEPASTVRAAATDPDRTGIFPLLGYYLAVARRRRLLILGAVVAALAAALIIILLTTPLYSATATVEIRRENDNIVRVQGVEPETNIGDMEFYQTQYGLLASRSLAERVATDMRLYDNQTFFAMYGLPQAEIWFNDGRVVPGASTREARVRKAADLLLANFWINPVRLSRLVRLNFSSPDPEFSARVVNSWSDRFIRTTLERRFEATSYARQFLEQRLQQLRSRLDASERQLVAYAAQQGIVNLPAGSGAPGTAERSLVADNLATLNRELSQATIDSVRAQTRLTAPSGAVTEALENQAIGGLRLRRATLSAEYARMMAQFEPEYPPAVALRQEIAQLDRSIGAEEARVRTTLQATYRAQTARESNLNNRVENLKGSVLDLRRRSIQYNIFQREVDTNSQLYDALLQRYKEIGVAGGVGVNNISIVDGAQVPERPSSPRVLFYLAIALALGGIAGFGLALVFEQLDDAISDPADIEALLGTPLLGAIPMCKGEEAYTALEDRKSDLSEAYMAVQTSLAFSTAHGAPASLAITSTRPGEGKSTTAYAIARSLARTGRKVLLVDGDMRAPSVHIHSGLDNKRGLSNFLIGDDNLATMTFQIAGTDMWVMPAGPQPPSAAELLGGERLNHLMEKLSAQFDHVVIDSPPVMGLADAPLLASHAEGTVFVIESHRTQVREAKVAIERLAAANVHLLGVVLAKFNASRTTYGYGYDYGYGYGRTAEAGS